MKKHLFISLLIIFVSLFILYSKISIAEVGAPSSGGVVQLSNPLGPGSDTPTELIGTIINAVLGIVGSLALAMFIYGGLIWMTAAGNQERVTKGKNILIWATIGLAVIFSAYVMVRFVFSSIGVQEASPRTTKGHNINI